MKITLHDSTYGQDHTIILIPRNDENDNLISYTDYPSSCTWYLHPYNIQIMQFCIDFFEKIIAEGINIRIVEKQSLQYIHVKYSESVEFSERQNQ